MTMLGTYYADRFVGRKTAGGDIFRQNQFTAAHKSIPLGTYLRVINPYTGLQIVVRVNDRCPIPNVLDMTKIDVLKLGIKGSRRVKVVALSPEEGYALWVRQDTLGMTYEEYMTFKDPSPVRRMTPYADNKALARAVPSPAPPAVTPVATPPAAIAADNDDEDFAEEDAYITLPRHLQLPPAPPADPLDDMDPDEPCFNLELCIVGSRQAASRAIARLPRRLQGQAECQLLAATRQIRVILRLEDTRAHAIRTQAMLIDAYPECDLIPVENR